MPLKPETAINWVIGIDGLSSFAYKYMDEFPIYNDKIPTREELAEFCGKWHFDKLDEVTYKKLANALELLSAVRNDFGGHEYNNDIRPELHSMNIQIHKLRKAVEGEDYEY